MPERGTISGGRAGKLKVLSLFAGGGGIDLGLERSGGFRTVAFCEIDPYARAVLAKHWPEVPCYHDVRELSADRLRADGIFPDFIAGGFPCQDISIAGRGGGLSGERSGLFFEIVRLIRELGPEGVLLENVAALLRRGLGEVLGSLASVGYDAEWDCIPAAAVGALHKRDRIWISAYPNANGLRPQRVRTAATGAWCEQQFARLVQDQIRLSVPAGSRSGISDGVSGRMGQLKLYGNSVLPQIPELIGDAWATGA